MLGNVSEWCHDRHRDQLPRSNELVRDELGAEVVMGEKRNMRGETFAMIPAGLRSAAHAWYDPTEVKADFGFRPARNDSLTAHRSALLPPSFSLSYAVPTSPHTAQKSARQYIIAMTIS